MRTDVVVQLAGLPQAAHGGVPHAVPGLGGGEVGERDLTRGTESGFLTSTLRVIKYTN